MSHPFELNLTVLQTLDLEFEETLGDQSRQISGSTRYIPRCDDDYDPRPRPKPLPPKPYPPKPICPIEPPIATTLALGEEGGWTPPPYTTMALGEEGGYSPD